MLPRLLRRQKLTIALPVLAIAGIYGAELLLAGLAASSFGDSSRPFWSISEASPIHKKQFEKIAASFGVTIDARTRADVAAEMHKHHIDAVPAVDVSWPLDDQNPTRSRAIDVDKLMPLGGISNSGTVLCNESGQFVIYESDEHGFRNPRGLWSASRADMAVVGQSFAQGYCVPEGKGFVDLLRKEYPVTFNVGLSGLGSLLQLGAIKEFLPRYAPKIVLWVFQEGIDLESLRQETQHPQLTRYLDPDFSQHLLARQVEIDAAWRRFVSDMEAAEREARTASKPSSIAYETVAILKLWNLRGWVAATYAQDDARDVAFLEESHERLFTSIVQQAQSITSSWGGRLYFVYLPSWSRYRHNARATELERTSVLKIVRALQIPVIDIHPAFQAQSDPLSLFPFRRSGHYNESGNRIVAETILNALGTGHEGQVSGLRRPSYLNTVTENPWRFRRRGD